MENSRTLRVLLAAAAALAWGDAHAIYKCTDAQGRTTYQQTPCASTATQTSIGAERKLPSAQRSATPMPSDLARPPGVATLMSAVVRCSEQSPAFAERIQPYYKRWSEANIDNVQSYQRSPDYSRVVTDSRKVRAASGGRMSPELAAECRKTEDFFAQNWGPPAK